MTLDECLDTLLAQLDQDHWKVAFALSGVAGEAPVDRELAALHEAVVGRRTPCALLDVADEHPDAVARHMVWVTETLHGNGPASVRCSASSPPVEVLPIASSLSAALQPVVGLDGQVLGFEGLLRGLEAPDALFRRAVSEGWVEALDRCAAVLALHAASRWAGDDEKVFVNAAPMTVTKLADWLQHVIVTARRIGIDRSRLVIELNENQTGCDQPELLRCVAGARRLGVSFALDDVDAGPRCVRDIELLRPEFVKLDGAVVHAVADPSVREHVSNVVALCNRLGSVLVAEKVETEGQVDALIALGVRHFQGWLTGIPVAGSRPSTRGWSRAA